MNGRSVDILLVEFRVHARHVAAFEAAIRHNARTSLADEPGCRQFDVCVDPAEPGRFVLYEVYDDEAAVRAHLASAHFAAFDAQCAPWVAAKRVQRLRRCAP